MTIIAARRNETIGIVDILQRVYRDKVFNLIEFLDVISNESFPFSVVCFRYVIMFQSFT